MTRAITVSLGLVFASGCGGEPTFEIRLPWPAALARADCVASIAEFEDKLEAGLRIGGHNECPLTVDKTDRTVSGTCQRVTVGMVRPVALVWYLEPPSGARRAQLQYHVSFVNLVKASLTAETTSVAIDFVDDGTNGTVWYHPDELTEIPALVPDDRNGLEHAMYWAGGEMAPKYNNDVQPYLDRDGDGCPNLVEACDGVLYNDLDMWTGSPGVNSTCSLPDPPQ